MAAAQRDLLAEAEQWLADAPNAQQRELAERIRKALAKRQHIPHSERHQCAIHHAPTILASVA